MDKRGFRSWHSGAKFGGELPSRVHLTHGASWRPTRSPAPEPHSEHISAPTHVGAVPSPPDQTRLGPPDRLALIAGRAAGRVSVALGLGSGTTVGGRVALALRPALLRRLATGRQVALISGTNGKTTTTLMLAEALRTRGAVLTNASGANLPAGHVHVLGADRSCSRVVLEVDEAYLEQVTAATAPALIVLLNLTRDQLDRTNETRRLGDRWRRTVAASAGTSVVVANADDPLTAWAAGAARSVVWVAASCQWSADSTLCPRCNTLLAGQGREWSCPGCGLHRPRPHYAVTGDAVRLSDGTLMPLGLRLPGQVNRANAAVAVAAAEVLGAPAAHTVQPISHLHTVAGRYATVHLNGHGLRLLLAKNPGGWLETLPLVRDSADPLVIAVNARAADGRDTSWLWDVPFEQLRGHTVLAVGDRRTDLAVRLRFAGVGCTPVEDLAAALAEFPATPTPTDCVANYTAFQDLRTRTRA